jgi:hypothetical protein
MIPRYNPIKSNPIAAVSNIRTPFFPGKRLHDFLAPHPLLAVGCLTHYTAVDFGDKVKRS